MKMKTDKFKSENELQTFIYTLNTIRKTILKPLIETMNFLEKNPARTKVVTDNNVLQQSHILII